MCGSRLNLCLRMIGISIVVQLGKKRALQGSAKKALGDGKKPRLDTPAKPGLSNVLFHDRSERGGILSLVTFSETSSCLILSTYFCIEVFG